MRGTLAKLTGTGALDATGAEILHAASLAASSHNIQPWVVRVHGPRHWTICADPARRLPAVDPANREPVLSIGAFLENLDLAAGAAGYAAEIRPLTGDRRARDLAEVRLESAPATGYDMARITARRTVRGGYLDRPLDAAHRARLLEAFAGRGHFYDQDSPGGAYLRENTLAAFRQQTWRDEAQRELAEWIRFDAGEAERHRDGLTPATMEITGLAGWFVRTFYDRERVMSEGFRERGIDGVAHQVEQGGGWIVVTAGDDQAGTLLDTGRRLQRMLNSARDLGVAVHPMSQMVQESPWTERMAADLELPAAPRLVLRAGYVEAYPDPVSLRRPLEEFVIESAPV